jgi:hypothetical protein
MCKLLSGVEAALDYRTGAKLVVVVVDLRAFVILFGVARSECMSRQTTESQGIDTINICLSLHVRGIEDRNDAPRFATSGPHFARRYRAWLQE